MVFLHLYLLRKLEWSLWKQGKQVGRSRNIQIKEEEVLAILRQIRVDKSPGPDRVFPQTLKETGVEIAGALAEIFKMSISTGQVLEDWRIAHVVPLFKKGLKSKPGNYRPVSLTLVVGK